MRGSRFAEYAEHSVDRRIQLMCWVESLFCKTPDSLNPLIQAEPRSVELVPGTWFSRITRHFLMPEISWNRMYIATSFQRIWRFKKSGRLAPNSSSRKVTWVTWSQEQNRIMRANR